MMSFCKSKVHSFLGFANHGCTDKDPPYSSRCCRNIPSPAACSAGLSFLTAASHESTPVESAASSPLTPKRDPGGIGFIDEVGGGVDGLMSCTESLGFESSDERGVDDQIEEMSNGETTGAAPEEASCKWRKTNMKREVKRFPPPLPSLDRNGQPSFFLLPVRKDGRLELIEVRVSRPEILRASREDGRLKLHLIRGVDEEEEEVTEEEREEDVDEEDKSSEIVFPAGVGGGEVRRSCGPGHGCGCGGGGLNHPNGSSEPCHHHHMHVWRQHCVTTT
ncbi:uncharacterized protein LOC131152926 [Malania oleifera]|uniref:uncharacterized protein LOC131152926 n=1 Tax=Malania oleifera TaxID=397392 RepID=UPI0025ADFB4E|nr:uncharacterized protein LOC131152926 [Malania oleifera]